MSSAPLPPDEHRRITTLDALDIMDSTTEKVFDDITRFAVALCGVSIGFVSLVHRERQWFKSRVGSDLCETPRDQAFCAHAILGTDVMVVEDAARDIRFLDNPLVTEPDGIRFYAGAPLIHPNGSVLGSLCVIDTRPAGLTALQRQGLKLLADQVVQAMVLRHRQARESGGVGHELQQVLDLSADAILITDLTGLVLNWNPAATRILGYTSAEMVGQNVSRIVPMGMRTDHTKGMARFTRTGVSQQMGKVLELRALHRDGHEVDIELVLSRSWVMDQPGLMAVIRDISARKAAEAERQRLKQRYRVTLEAVADAVFAVDPQGVVELANPPAAALVGEPVDQIVGRRWNDVLVFQCTRMDQRGCGPLKRWREGMLEQRASENAMLQRMDGAVRIVNYTLSPVPEATGMSMVLSVRDVTEQQQQLESLQDHRERLDAVLATTGAVIYSACLPDLTIDFVSESVVPMLGYPVTEVQQPGFWSSILHPQDIDRFIQGHTSLYERGHHVQEYRVRHKVGYHIWVRDEVRLVRNADGLPIRAIGASFNISSRKRDDHMLRTMLVVRELVTALMRRSLVEQMRDPEELLAPLLQELARVFGASIIELVLVAPTVVTRRHRWGEPDEGTVQAVDSLMVDRYRNILASHNPVILAREPAEERRASLVAVPLQVQPSGVLVLALGNVEEDPLSLTDVVDLLAPVMEAYDAASTRLQIARQLQAANRRLAATNRLHREVFGLSSRAANCKSRTELLELLARRVGVVTRAQRVALVERVPGGEGVQLALLHADAATEPIRIVLEGTAVAEVLRTGAPLSSRTADLKLYVDWERLSAQGLRNFLNCPLVSAEGVSGSLNFAWGPDVELTQEDEEVYVQLALVIGAHLQVYRSLDQLTDINTDLERRVHSRTEALVRSEHRFQRLFEASPVPLVLLNEERVVQANAAAEVLLGRGRGELLNQPLSLPLPAAAPPLLLDGTQPVLAILQRPQGPTTTVELRRTEIELDQGNWVIVSISDVGAHIAAQQHAEKSLHEKETLLKEIHHRVKNNLQIISSLLAMQARGAAEEETRTLLHDSVMRIRSMGLIHEQLYQADQLSRIDLGAYLRQLSRYLAHSLHPEPGFEIDVQSEEVWMTVENAVPCGLVMNELIVNSLKHAGQPGVLCKISIKIHIDAGNIVLSISDNGPGMPKDYLSPGRRSFGLRLVSTLVQQLRGTIAWERNDTSCAGGTCESGETCSGRGTQGSCVCLRIPTELAFASLA
jgi:PAS domain S-box-containing protein